MTFAQDNGNLVQYTAKEFANQPTYSYLTPEEYERLVEEERLRTMVYELPEMPADSTYSFVEKTAHLETKGAVGFTNKRAYISQTVKPGSNPLGTSHSLATDEYMLISDKKKIRGEDYYVAARDGKAFFIKAEDVTPEPTILRAYGGHR